MGWHINEVENTVVITKQLAQELFDSTDRWDFGDPVSESDIMDYGVAFTDDAGVLRLHFNDDDMEHMDFIEDKKVQNILKKHKVKGDICFSSNDGDNSGQSWGYRFDGKGGMVKLEGTLGWTEVNPKPVKKVTTKKSSKSLKKPTVGKKTATKWICTSCFNDKSLDEEDQYGLPRGTDIRKESRNVSRYCGTCGEDYSIEKV